MSGRSLGDYNVTRTTHHSHAIRVQQLAIPFAAFAKLELETSLFVKNLDTMVIGVSHHNVILGIDGHARGLSELAFQHPKFTEFAVVHHLLPLDLGLGRKASVEGRDPILGWATGRAAQTGRACVAAQGRR